MLQTAFNCGLAANKAAVTASLGVENRPSLSRTFCSSSSAGKIRSSWLDSTSKCCARRSSTSGNTARATKILGFMLISSRLSLLFLNEKQEGHDNKQRHQNGQ